MPLSTSWTAQTLVAHHEAGHAVLGAALGATPHFVTIRAEGARLGHTLLTTSASPSHLTQIHLAGYAAEHVHTGRRSAELTREVRFALLARSDRELAGAFPGSDACDGHGAIESLLRTASFDDDELEREIERLYVVVVESLRSVWPAVDTLARALLEQEALDRDEMTALLGGGDLETPVRVVQRRHELVTAFGRSLSTPPPSPAAATAPAGSRRSP